MALNQYNNGAAFERGGEERIWHELDDGGDCLVPWCTYSDRVKGSEHINIDRVFEEPGQFNLFKNHETHVRNDVQMREVLFTEFSDEVNEDADARMMATHNLTLRVLRLLKNKADGRNEKADVLGREHRKAMDQLSTIVKFIYDTLPLRANAIDPTGEMETANLVIAVMGQLRRDLLHATADRDVWMTSTNEPAFIPDDEKTGPACKHEGADAEPICNLKRHEDDPMQPHARRERTLNELHTLLHNMLLSGVDVAVRDLQDYLQRHVTAVHALVTTSLELEGYSDECCIGCEEHAPGDRPHGKSRSRTEELSQMIPTIEELRKGRR